jgi:hypothetical protein
VLFSFPLIYYITSPEVYYRRPIDPFLVILAIGALMKNGSQWPVVGGQQRAWDSQTEPNPRGPKKERRPN